MDVFKTVLQSLPLLLVTTAVTYRLACKALGLQRSRAFTFCTMALVSILAGWLNLRLGLAGTIGENALYSGAITFGLYLFLFKGNIVKKGFLTVLICAGIPISFYIFLPLASYLFGQARAEFLLALKALEYVNALLYVAAMEYVGRKFQNLRRELPNGYTIYLTAVILFVYVAVYSGYEQMLVRNDGVVSLLSAFTTTVFAVAGMVIVIVAIFAVDRQVNVSLKEQLHIMQAENFKNRELEWHRFSGFRHDIKNHLLCLNNLLDNGKAQEATSYIRNITDTVKQFDSPVRTGNDYADALLSVKYAEAIQANIRVSLDLAIPEQGYIEPVDLCCILSNAFDNAIAACKRLTDGERWITARAFVRQGQLVIEIKNSKPSYVTVVDGEVSPKEITAAHGIGLDIVKAVVEQYGGILDLATDDSFSFSVLLPPYRL